MVLKKTLTLLLTIYAISDFGLYAQETMFVQSETRFWDQANSYNGYTLFGATGKTY